MISSETYYNSVNRILVGFQLTFHTVVFLVVEAEVVSKLPAHNQLLNEGGHRLTRVLPTALNLQRHTLS